MIGFSLNLRYLEIAYVLNSTVQRVIENHIREAAVMSLIRL